MTPMLRASLACGALLALASAVPLTTAAQNAPSQPYTITVMPPGGPAAALAQRQTRPVGPLAAKQRRAGRERPLRRGPGGSAAVRPEGHAGRTAVVPAVGAREDQGDDADGAGAVEVVGELHAARRAGHLAAEPLLHHAGPQAGHAGAALRGAEQLPRDPHRRPSAAQVPGAALPRQQRRAVGGRHAGGGIHRLRRAHLRDAERVVPQRRAARGGAVHTAVDELPDRRGHGRRPQGADQAVEVGAPPLDAGQRRDLRVLLHQQQGARRAGEAPRAGTAKEKK